VSVLTTLPYTLQEPDFPYASGNVPDAVCHVWKNDGGWVDVQDLKIQ